MNGCRVHEVVVVGRWLPLQNVSSINQQHVILAVPGALLRHIFVYACHASRFIRVTHEVVGEVVAVDVGGAYYLQACTFACLLHLCLCLVRLQYFRHELRSSILRNHKCCEAQHDDVVKSKCFHEL